MTLFLDDNEITTDKQHGFLKHITNLLRCFENWTQAVDYGYDVDVIYLDHRITGQESL